MEKPSDKALIDAVKAVRVENPEMGRRKLGLKLRREHKNWDFSEARLKAILVEHQLNTEQTQKSKEEIRPKYDLLSLLVYHADRFARILDNAYKALIRPVFEEYREKERAFLLELSDKDRSLLDLRRDRPISEAHYRLLQRRNGKPFQKNDPRLPGLFKRKKSPKPKWYFAAHFRFHVQILMVLLGVKTVTLFSHPEFKGNAVLERMVEHCLKPVMEKYKLAQYGFVVQKIEQPMHTEGGSSFQGALIFANKRTSNPLLNADIENVFNTFHIGKIFSEVTLAKLLGYPMAGTPGQGLVRYRDMTEMAWLWKTVGKDQNKISSQFFVPGLDYSCGESPEHFAHSLSHFTVWEDAARDVGVTLMLDTKANLKFEAWKEASNAKK